MNFLDQLKNGSSASKSESSEEDELTRCIFIPTITGDHIKISIDDLPDPNNIKQLITVLQDNQADVQLWHRIALEYQRMGHMKAFEKLVDTAAEPDLSRHDWKEEEVKYAGDTDARVALLNCRGSLYINSMSEGGSGSDGLAASCFNLADKISLKRPTNIFSKPNLNYDPSSWVGKALFNYSQRGDKTLNRKKIFGDLQKALQQEKEHVPALMAKGCISYAEKKYEEALKCFQLAFEANTKDGPAEPEIYLGVGVCAMALKEHEIAERSFRRVLEVSDTCPVSIRARAGLVMILQRKNDEKSIQESLKYLTEAHELSHSDPTILVLLGHIFFWKGEYAIARKSAGVAYTNTSSDCKELRAECCFLLGKTYHAEKDYTNAQKYYEKATKFDPQHIAVFGLAQMYIYRGQKKQAFDALKKISEIYPENMTTSKIMADLYQENSKFDDAKQCLKKYLQSQPNDVNACIRLAQICESSDLKAALDAYQKAVKLMKEQNISPPFEIYNNISSLHHELGNNSDALNWCEQLINSFVQEDYRIDITRSRRRKHKLPANAVTVYYNYGIFLQQEGRMTDAIYVYGEIISDYPQDIDCYLRVGMIQSAMGDERGANDTFDLAIRRANESKLSDIDARSMKAQCCLRLGLHAESYKQLRDIHKKNKSDVYNIVALGNHNLLTKSKEDNTKFREAARWYYRALQLDPKNIFAANGLAVVLAELNLLTEGQLILQELQQVSDDTDFLVNFGNIFVKKETYPVAIKRYEAALRKLPDNEYNEIAMYLAQVLNFTDNKQGTKNIYTSILHRDPNNEDAWFQLAHAQQTNAISILQKDHFTRTMEEMELAIDDLNQAISTFERLASTATGKRKERCVKFAKYCKTTLQKGGEFLKWHRTQDKKKEEKKQIEHERVKDWISRKEAAKAEVEEQRQKLFEERKRKAIENRKQADVLGKELKASTEQQEQRRRSRNQKRKKDILLEEEDDPAVEFNGEIGDVVDTLDFDLGDDPSRPNQGTKRKYEDDNFQMPQPPKKKKKKKKKRLIQRNDDDSDIMQELGLDGGFPGETESAPAPVPRKKKKKKSVVVNFDERTGWSELQHSLYQHTDLILKSQDVSGLSRKKIREQLAVELGQDISSEKGFIASCIAYLLELRLQAEAEVTN